MHSGKSYVEKVEDKSVPRQSRFIRQSRFGNKTKNLTHSLETNGTILDAKWNVRVV